MLLERPLAGRRSLASGLEVSVSVDTWLTVQLPCVVTMSNTDKEGHCYLVLGVDTLADTSGKSDNQSR